MTPAEFVEAIEKTAAEAALRNTLKSLAQPDPRLASAQEKVLAEWFAKLDEGDRRNLKAVLAQGINAALFGVFCVLDGVRAISSDPDAELEVTWVQGSGKRIPLVGPPNEMLHDIYRGIM